MTSVHSLHFLEGTDLLLMEDWICDFWDYYVLGKGDSYDPNSSLDETHITVLKAYVNILLEERKGVKSEMTDAHIEEDGVYIEWHHIT